MRGIGHVERGERRQERAWIRPAPPRALGLAGGPRGVDSGRPEHLSAGQLHRLRPARRDEVGEGDGPVVAALGPEQDPGAHLGRLAAHGVRHGHEGIAHECRRSLRILEDVGDLVGGEAMVHGDGNGARRPDRGRGDEHIEAVVRVQDDVLPARDPEPDERMREAVARVPELGPGEPAVPFDQGRPLGMPVRMRRDDVHVPGRFKNGQGARRYDLRGGSRRFR